VCRTGIVRSRDDARFRGSSSRHQPDLGRESRSPFRDDCIPASAIASRCRRCASGSRTIRRSSKTAAVICRRVAGDLPPSSSNGKRSRRSSVSGPATAAGQRARARAMRAERAGPRSTRHCRRTRARTRTRGKLDRALVDSVSPGCGARPVLRAPLQLTGSYVEAASASGSITDREGARRLTSVSSLPRDEEAGIHGYRCRGLPSSPCGVDAPRVRAASRVAAVALCFGVGALVFAVRRHPARGRVSRVASALA